MVYSCIWAAVLNLSKRSLALTRVAELLGFAAISARSRSRLAVSVASTAFGILSYHPLGCSSGKKSQHQSKNEFISRLTVVVTLFHARRPGATGARSVEVLLFPHALLPPTIAFVATIAWLGRQLSIYLNKEAPDISSPVKTRRCRGKRIRLRPTAGWQAGHAVDLSGVPSERTDGPFGEIYNNIAGFRIRCDVHRDWGLPHGVPG